MDQPLVAPLTRRRFCTGSVVMYRFAPDSACSSVGGDRDRRGSFDACIGASKQRNLLGDRVNQMLVSLAGRPTMSSSCTIASLRRLQESSPV